MSFKEKIILIVCGGCQKHKHDFFAKKIANCLENKNTSITLSESTEICTNKVIMGNVDLVIHHITIGKIKPDKSKALQKAISKGVGLAGCHGGLGDSFREDTEFQYIAGGHFFMHSGGQNNYTVNITDPNNSITKGISDFLIFSEQYYMHVDPNLNILASTQFSGNHDYWIEGVKVPVVWTKRYGKGNVFYSSLDHSVDVFEKDEIWTLMTHGISWAIQN